MTRLQPQALARRFISAAVSVSGAATLMIAAVANAHEVLERCNVAETPTVLGKARYPSVMGARDVNGIVTLDFRIDENGEASAPQVLFSSSSLFEGGANLALKRSRFEPRQRPCRHRLTFAIERRDNKWTTRLVARDD